MKKSQLQIELESKISQMESKIEALQAESDERIEKLRRRIAQYTRVVKYEIREQKK